PNNTDPIKVTCLPWKISGKTDGATTFMQYQINNGGFPGPVQLDLMPGSDGKKKWSFSLGPLDLPSPSPPNYILTISELTNGVMVTTDRFVNCVSVAPCPP